MQHLAGHYYHVYNRGCNRERIFVNDDNYRYLLKQAKQFLPNAPLSMVAYCLMPNHYHFLLRSEADDATGRFISACSTATRKPSTGSRAAAERCLKAAPKVFTWMMNTI